MKAYKIMSILSVVVFFGAANAQPADEANRSNDLKYLSVIMNEYRERSGSALCTLPPSMQKRFDAYPDLTKVEYDSYGPIEFLGRERESYLNGKHRDLKTTFGYRTSSIVDDWYYGRNSRDLPAYQAKEAVISIRQIKTAIKVQDSFGFWEWKEVNRPYAGDSEVVSVFPTEPSDFIVRGTSDCTKKFIELIGKYDDGFWAEYVGSFNYKDPQANLKKYDIVSIVNKEEAGVRAEEMTSAAQQLCDQINGVEKLQSKITVSNESTFIPRSSIPKSLREGFFSDKSILFNIKIRCYLNE